MADGAGASRIPMWLSSVSAAAGTSVSAVGTKHSPFQASQPSKEVLRAAGSSGVLRIDQLPLRFKSQPIKTPMRSAAKFGSNERLAATNFGSNVGVRNGRAAGSPGASTTSLHTLPSSVMGSMSDRRNQFSEPARPACMEVCASTAPICKLEVCASTAPMLGGLLINMRGSLKAAGAGQVGALLSMGDTAEEANEDSPLLMDSIDVILAVEDEAQASLLKAGLASFGVCDSRIRHACDGFDAMDLLLEMQSSKRLEPLLMFIDIDMPQLTGRKCASMAAEMTSRNLLSRVPYLIAVVKRSAVAGQHPYCHGTLSNHAFSPLQLPDGDLLRALQAFQRWLHKQPSGKMHAWNEFDVTGFHCVIADEAPIWHDTLRCMLQALGFPSSQLQATDRIDEVVPLVKELQERHPQFPVLVFLSQKFECTSENEYTAMLSALCGTDAFLVRVSAAELMSEQDLQRFHCVLPKSFVAKRGLTWVLRLFQLYRASKGRAACVSIVS